MLTEAAREAGVATPDGHSKGITPMIREWVPIVKAFSIHAQNYCDVEGKSTSEVKRIKYATNPLVERFSAMPAQEFGPLKLKQVRQHMIDLDLARKSINGRIARIKRLFRWAASEE